MKMKRRILSLLFTVCLVVGLMPTTAFADTGKAIQFVDSGAAANISGGQADSIYFGNYYQSDVDGNTKDPILWRVLSNSDGKLFLLSDQNLDVFEYHKDDEGVTWETSTMRSWLNGYTADKNIGDSDGNPDTENDKDSGIDYTSDNFINAAFSAKEQGAIVETFLYNETQSDGISNPNPQWGTPGGNNTTDKIFLLSLEEAANSSYFPKGDDDRIGKNTAYVEGGGTIDSDNVKQGNGAGLWWLRSPGDYEFIATNVDFGGWVFLYGQTVDSGYTTVRPAFNLNLGSVLFTSAAAGGKSSGAVGADALKEIPDVIELDTAKDGEPTNDNDWKLTLLDSRRNFSVTETAAAGESGDTITLNYTGATTGTNEYISVIIADNEGAKYYGRIAQPDSANGTVDVKIPANLADGTYTLNVFSEQYNGGDDDDTKLTDYASAFEKVTLTVYNTAPTLSNGTASRDSETAATVKFTGNEAGTYYYKVVESGAQAPTIDTMGTGAVCTNGENTIDLTNLSGTGAKDIYIVVKDAAGNESSPLKIEIPAYDDGGYTYYIITLPTGTGYTAEAAEGFASPVEEGKDYSFKLEIAKGYRAGADFAVKANDTALKKENGIYTISNITADQVITVTGVVEDTVTPEDVVNEVDTSPLDDVPEELKEEFDSVEELKKELMSRILTTPGYSMANSVFYDVKLQFSLDGGITWIDATEDNFPTCGITVKFDYPQGTSGDTHDFQISHMFTVTSERLGTTAGGTEQPPVTELDDGIQATFNGLSPVSISWKETAQITPTDPTDETTDEPTDEPTAPSEDPTTETGDDTEGNDSGASTGNGSGASTGDGSNMLPWIIMAVTAVMVGAGTILGHRKKCDS